MAVVYMKNISIAFLLISLFTSLKGFAYVNGKNISAQNVHLCPVQMICLKRDDISSCSPLNDSSPDWSQPNTYVSSELREGKYHFSRADSPYHSNSNLSVHCFYAIDGFPLSILRLDSKAIANLEGDYEKNKNWINFPPSTEISCNASFDNNPQTCPLIEKSALVLFNKDIILGVTAVEGSSGTTLQKITINKYFSILSDDVISQCGSFKECTIRLVSSTNRYYGMIKVDMNNNFKIISVESENSSGVIVSQIEFSNAIEIKFHRKNKLLFQNTN
jgi:hypothetical protein